MNVMNRLVVQDYRIMMMHTMLMNVMISNPSDFDVVIFERVSTLFYIVEQDERKRKKEKFEELKKCKKSTCDACDLKIKIKA